MALSEIIMIIIKIMYYYWRNIISLYITIYFRFYLPGTFSSLLVGELDKRLVLIPVLPIYIQASLPTQVLRMNHVCELRAPHALFGGPNLISIHRYCSLFSATVLFVWVGCDYGTSFLISANTHFIYRCSSILALDWTWWPIR